MRPIDHRVKGLEAMLREISRISEEIVGSVVSMRTTPDSIRRSVDDVKRRRLEIHGSIVEIIARYQPTASDLRGLIAALEISYGLYRFSRYALDISTILDRVVRVSGAKCDLKYSSKISKHVIDMVRGSIEAFLKRDKNKARSVIEMDRLVDQAFFEALDEASRSTDACSTLDLLILMYLERIADHSVYIAQETIDML